MKHQKIISLFIAIGGVFIFAAFLVLTLNTYVRQEGKKYIISAEQAKTQKADCILVLGARVYNDNSLSNMLLHRVETGIELFNAGASNRLLMSGDHGTEDYDEVNAMKLHAVTNGIDSDSIFLDHAGFSTYDSIYRAKEVFGCKKIIIVTQEYHLPRALFIAQQLGLEAYGVIADKGIYKTSFINESREILARVKAAVFTAFKPEPKYLGNPIPISGKGSQTDD
ncbi:MAG: ElyC/SanA/YdcF family protein [Clostridia bacterium]